MADKPETYPDGSANQAYWDERERQAQEANLAGLKHRVLELEGMPDARPEQIAAAKEAVKEAEKLVAGSKPKAKRPARARSASSRLKGGEKEKR